jgi:predicted signal transduction protein with EAL and GGDEF domain
VVDLGHTRAGDTIASAVVGLAHGLGLAAVAEAVETNAQAAALAGLRVREQLRSDAMRSYAADRSSAPLLKPRSGRAVS